MNQQSPPEEDGHNVEHLSVRQLLILRRISLCLYIHVCMSVTLRNANYVHMARTCNCVSGGDVHNKLQPIILYGNAACKNRSSKSLHLRSSTSISEMSENHGTDEAMDNSRPHSNSTSKPEEDRYQTSDTVSDTLKAETGSNEAMHNSSSHCTSDSFT